MPAWLLLRLTGLKSAIGSALHWTARNPLIALCAILTVAAALFYHQRNTARHDRDVAVTGRATDHKSYIAAQEAATAAQIAATKAVEARYATKAKDADHAYQIALTDADAAARRYAAAHLVRPGCAASASSGSIAPAESRGAGVSTAVSEGADVAISDADLQICTANTVYAVKAHDWAVGLEVKEE